MRLSNDELILPIIIIDNLLYILVNTLAFNKTIQHIIFGLILISKDQSSLPLVEMFRAEAFEELESY